MWAPDKSQKKDNQGITIFAFGIDLFLSNYLHHFIGNPIIHQPIINLENTEKIMSWLLYEIETP